MKRLGFTLIELLVVITILAVLAGAALPYVQSYVEESKIAKAKTDLEEIARALAVYETREGEYAKGDVTDLTGRYLNKAPIDPWGKGYTVATDAGVVFSSGADRLPNTADDISAPYQPPLALVQVKWIDKNQSGAVDTQNVNDRVQLFFSRKIKNPIADFSPLSGIFAISSGTMSDAFIDNVASITGFPTGATTTIELTVRTNTTNAFTPGSDTIRIITNHGKLKDMKDNLALDNQRVRILPQ